MNRISYDQLSQGSTPPLISSQDLPQHQLSPSAIGAERISPPMTSPSFTQFLPHLLIQAKDGGTGLGKIPQKTLRDNLQPVVDALTQLDAVSLLDLTTICGKNPRCGPKVKDG